MDGSVNVYNFPAVHSGEARQDPLASVLGHVPAHRGRHRALSGRHQERVLKPSQYTQVNYI